LSERDEARWARLMALLEPIHRQAAATARRLCRTPSDGDDLYQEAVLRAFDKLHGLRDASRFRSWFFAILLSRHRSQARRAFWRRRLPWREAFPDGADPAGEDGSDWDARGGSAARAARALSTLAAEQREAVVLFEIDGYSIEEIATLQRASVPAVKSRLTRGRDRLRQWYERHGFTPAAGDPEPRKRAAVSPPERLRGLATASGGEDLGHD
jgi:RNA polymerase sigma-70 factor (ECF subfamily)